MAEESAKPPTITTPVGHMRTCEHLAWQERHAAAVSGRLLAERGGSAENAGIGMDASCWQLAARNGIAAEENAGNAGGRVENAGILRALMAG